MFWVFLLTVAMIVVLLKLGAASVTVNVLSIALIGSGVVIVILLFVLFRLARQKVPDRPPLRLPK
jgi:hypothetical protein